ncbi:SycD/LcrH family type III secretion system chaperone [Halodesulfovibrio marinisediminis]|uniref:Type III secretion low calcium response chaperone LcrH/SycD n=1 Tax=Halodesulfovibrio marinisediminis DSM 17456 TaxID=1121457 RepID=A0A1N6I9C9_9BACT|nr:SycD/LcrH family type III secretion system chaperone [Halodesulfovibrio marinisediminis]SIO28610.1 type III secretion low calcium response chaperone LcrH/SycD [Halodesulfovibrio marinisediminis DSM 17456]
MSTMIEEQTMVEEQDELLAKALKAVLEDGAVLSELQGISEDDMEHTYAFAYEKYMAGNYKDAFEVFKLLTLMNHLESRFWLGLAGCAQELEALDIAIEAYAMAGFLEPENPIISLFGGTCLYKVGNFEAAKLALEAGVELAAESDQDLDAYVARAQATLEQMQSVGE